MSQENESAISCELVTEAPEFTLDDLCQNTGLSVDKITTYVEEGIIATHERHGTQWRYSRQSLIEIHRAARLERDLGLNVAGIALVLDLSSQIKELKNQLKQLAGASGE